MTIAAFKRLRNAARENPTGWALVRVDDLTALIEMAERLRVNEMQRKADHSTEVQP